MFFGLKRHCDQVNAYTYAHIAGPGTWPPKFPAHWARLDAFEGEAYERVIVAVATANGPVEA